MKSSISEVALKNKRPKLTEAEKEVIQNAFSLFANKETNLLDIDEFKDTMKSLELDKKNPKVFDWISKLEGKQLDLEDFLKELEAPIDNPISRERIDKLFDIFVEDESNTITLDHIENALKELGEELNAKQILDNLAENKREITREEFHAIFNKLIHD